ncbi:MAG: hypothetical protein JSU91_03720 [Thermoplasmatales archaeon]|nr:MAG: hypothetical protein JSU91_03720 [Thermoplasmatales archaeon]
MKGNSILFKKTLVIVIIFLFGISAIPSINGAVEKNELLFNPLCNTNDFWVHKDVAHFNITNEWILRAPEGNLVNTPYNYNDFSICPSLDTNYDPWIVWIDDKTGEMGSKRWIDQYTSNHASFSVQFDKEGYIWATVGGYGDINPFDLYKSNTKCSTGDYLDYTLLLNNYWSVIGSCGSIVMLLGDKLNLFFRNWWNDDPGTEIQQLQYDIDDFTTQLKNREVISGEWFEGSPLTPSYCWGKIDPRYNIGFLTVTYKHTLYSGKYWGSWPFVMVTNDGDILKDSLDQSYLLPIEYSSNADIAYDNIRLNIEANTDGTQMGITPNGNYYFLTHYREYSGGPKHHKLFINEGSGWNEVWTNTSANSHSVACGVTKDHVVLLYSKEEEHKNIYISVSEDDGITWNEEKLIITETDHISGIGIAQPAIDYTDNTLRFFYGKNNIGLGKTDSSKVQFAKLNTEDFARYPLIEIEEVKGGLFNIDATVINNGTDDVVNAIWNIDVEYGLIPIGRHSEGVIDLLTPGEKVDISSKLILGLGNCLVKIKVEMPDETEDSAEVDAKVFIFFIKL